MDITIFPRKLSGTIESMPSKSQLHRMLICAAFSSGKTMIHCAQGSGTDIDATVDCLRALGAEIVSSEDGYLVTPAASVAEKAELYCRESGSTLRFLLPVVGALGVDATFHLEGRLPFRPLSSLLEEMERMGCTVTWPSPCTLHCQGRLRPGNYQIPGNVSSQFISGLLLALNLIEGSTSLEIMGPIESAPYIELTKQTLQIFQDRKNPQETVRVEGDWSNAACFIAANALGSSVSVTGLNPISIQGDRAILDIAPSLQYYSVIDCSDIPDIVPVMAVLAAANSGAEFTGIQRLRMKESDRISSIVRMITALGGKVSTDENSIRILGTGLRGGNVDSCGDHRIAMAAAIAATVCSAPVTIYDAACVSKSYPAFWTDYSDLGGKYEFNLRK